MDGVRKVWRRFHAYVPCFSPSLRPPLLQPVGGEIIFPTNRRYVTANVSYIFANLLTSDLHCVAFTHSIEFSTAPSCIRFPVVGKILLSRTMNRLLTALSRLITLIPDPILVIVLYHLAFPEVSRRICRPLYVQDAYVTNDHRSLFTSSTTMASFKDVSHVDARQSIFTDVQGDVHVHVHIHSK